MRRYGLFQTLGLVVLGLSLLAGCATPVTSATGSSGAASRAVLTTTNGDGTVLDLWQWNFQAIQGVLPQVASAGYSAIQVSPVQGTKSNASLANGFAWYLFYQPTNLSVGNAQLGSAQDFKNLCDAAKPYGIKIIVDAVLNQVADNGTSGQFDPAVDPSIANYASFHNKGTVADWANRYSMTQQNLGNGPDWNTQDPAVQSKHLAFLNQAIGLGAGGFRFDAAKSIETNVGVDAGQSWAGNYWTTMMNGMTGASNLFLYGEVLSGANDNAAGYQNYMRTTAVDYIGTVSYALDSANLSTGNLMTISHTGGYTVAENPSKVVLYIENWDNYLGAVGTYTANYGYTKRLLANAVMASRANAVNIVFARPNETLWSDPVMAAVNNFKVKAMGQGEYLRNPSNTNSVLIVERGTLGATLINAGGSIWINSATALPAGTYTASPGGAVFTVSAGTLTGTMPGTTAVVIQASAPVAATPTFAPGSGAVTSGTTVTMTSSTAGSTVYYTTDGSIPTTASAHGTAGSGTASVAITAAVTLKALATASGYTNSTVGSSSYTISSGFASNYPSMSLRGTLNGWGTTPMALTADHLWQANVTLAAGAVSYKYDASGVWTSGQNWGTSSTAGTAGVNGGNLAFTAASAGTFTFTFNDATLAYSVTGGTSTAGTLTIVFVNNGSSQSVTFPGDANNWNLTANTLAAAPNTTSTVTVANAVTSTTLARGNNTSTLELQVCNTASGWSGSWGFGSWTKGANIGFSSGTSQLSIACNPGQNVTLTVNVAATTLTATVQ